MPCASNSGRLFLSTPSARRATRRGGQVGGMVAISIHALREEGDGKYDPARSKRKYFYPRPPRGGRPAGRVMFSKKRVISIHALREEGDNAICQLGYQELQFLSTPSARRATGHTLPAGCSR